MKNKLLIASAFFCALFSANADDITVWDFNLPTTATVFPSGDSNPATGTFDPFVNITGSSVTFTNIGGTTNSFGNPPSGGGGATSDPWISDNSALRLGQFPAASANNKSAGIQFFASTLGYENIQITFDQENSATASRYWRAQYTIDGGASWIDSTVFPSQGGTTWIKGRLVDLSTVSGVKNNPNFGFRYVSEFESTATGSGSAAYVANTPTSGYGTGGTCWIDMVRMTGVPLVTSNTDPTISAIPGQTNHANATFGPIAFTVGDAETAPDALTLSGSSSDQSVIQNGKITFGGSGTNRTVTIAPEANHYGLVQVTVTVTDEGAKAASSTFNVLIQPPNIVVSNITTSVNNAGSANITILNSEGFTGPFTVSASAANSTLLPEGSMVVTGSGTNRTLTITPAANQIGGSVVTVTATDGGLTVNFDLFVKVLDSSVFGFWDFNSKVRDNNPNTGDINASIGGGTAGPVGEGLLASLNSNVSAVDSDLDQGDNSKWRLGTFPTQGTSNKTTGVEFRLSTVGKESITMDWEHYNSATGSRYWRLQYSTDGSTFTDFNVYTNPVETTWISFSADLSALPDVANNPNFAVRLVSEFESTATGAGADNYKGTQASGAYSTAGTLWLDSVTFSGLPYNPANSVPTISSMNTQTTRVDTVTSPIAFTIFDAETAAENLTLSAISSAPTVANSFTFAGSGTNRTIVVTPQPGQTGNAAITVRVTDEGGKFAESTFQLVVLAANTPPTVSGLSNQVVVVGNIVSVPFSVNDLESSPDDLTYTFESFNSLMPTNALQVVGSGSNKAVQIDGTAGVLGASKFRLIVSDGTFSTTNIFNVKIVRPQTLALWNYNSVTPDNNTATGILDPAIGTGTAINIGGSTMSYGVLGNTAPDNRSTDIAPITDNSSLRVATFPVQGTANKTAGVEFHFSTVGYSNLVVCWDQQNSSTASRYWRVQYTTDGSTFVDYIGYTNLLDGITFAASANFTGVSGVDNNPNFGLRIVSEWESTAGAGFNDSYVGVQASGTYGTGGTFWTDMLSVTADGPPAAPPTIQVQLSGNSLQVSWPTTYSDYALENASALDGSSWQPAPGTRIQTNGFNVITVQPSGGAMFFRLKK